MRTPTVPTPEVTALLGELKVVDTEAQQAEDRRTKLVTDARTKGATWRQIAEALGVSTQAVWERYRNVPRQRDAS